VAWHDAIGATEEAVIRIGDYILPDKELQRRLATTHPCKQCGDVRYFKARLRDDGLCCPCFRSKQ
jgi:hypothetical protein